MYFQFFKYFIGYIFRAKTRQKLLVLAMVGLFISSFSLIVLQSTMGGLQKNLVERSQNVQGKGVIFLRQTDRNFADNILDLLKQQGLEAYPEYEIELLLRHGNYLSPVVVHGLDKSYGTPPFLSENNLDVTISGLDLVQKVQGTYKSEVFLISPSHLNSFLGEIPRQVSTRFYEIVTTGVPEIDLFHMWTRASLIYNLIKKRAMNKIRVYSPFVAGELKSILKESFGDKVYLETWEKQNEALVWSLKLETTVMVFLFVAMTTLVAISISSGFMIFFDKIKYDLISFWILGLSRKPLEKYCGLFIHSMGFVITFSGLVVGLIFLYLLDTYGVEILPEVFVDRKLPVSVSFKGILISFCVPYGISVIFSWFSLKSFKRDEKSFISRIRAIG